MISKKTTLILGAGASAHVGYPLGSGLLKSLCNIRMQKNYPSLPKKWPQDQVDDLLLTLSRSGHYSIDAFLEFSEHKGLGKYLIACQLKELEILDRLFPPYESGWYQILFSSLVSECGVNIEKNNISIITFNYDRSLEAYLHNTIQHRFDISGEKAWEHVSAIPVIHVHGILGGYPETEYTNSSDINVLLDIAEQIKIIHEIKDSEAEFCNSEFEVANKYLQESERIVFLGFGFHEDNVRRFNFFSPKTLDSREVFTTSHGLTGFEFTQTLERLEKYGLNNALGSHHGQPCDGLFRNFLKL